MPREDQRAEPPPAAHSRGHSDTCSSPRGLFPALAGHRQLSLAERGSPLAKEAAASCSPCSVTTSLSHWAHRLALPETSEIPQAVSLRGPEAPQSRAGARGWRLGHVGAVQPAASSRVQYVPDRRLAPAQLIGSACACAAPGSCCSPRPFSLR